MNCTSHYFSCQIFVAKWCERIQYPDKSTATDASKAESGNGSAPAAPFSPYAPGAAGQPSNAQLWDAFRAGALWAQSQGAQATVPAVMPPGYPFGQPTGAPPMPNGGDQAGWAYGQAGQEADAGEGPSLKKAKTENDDGSSTSNLEGGNNNVQI